MQIGYEIKGSVTEDHEPIIPPFLTGLDQCLAYLYQNSDYSYLVTPKPSKDFNYITQHVRKAIGRFTPNVGIIFYRINKGKLEFQPPIEPLRHNELTPREHEKKKSNFHKLVTDQMVCQKIRPRPWGRETDYF